MSEAKQEAKFFIKTISPYQITYPVVLDVEEQSQANLGKSALTKIVKAFLDEVNAAGYYGMLYSNKSWLTTCLDMSKLTGYEVWLAQCNTGRLRHVAVHLQGNRIWNRRLRRP